MRRRQFIAGVAGSVAFPLAGRALPANVPVVGVLSFNSAGPMMASRIDGFLRGLSELNYVADQNVSIEYRWAEFHGDRVPALADDLVRRRGAVIATFNGFTALAAKAANCDHPYHVRRWRRSGQDGTGRQHEPAGRQRDRREHVHR